MVIEITVCAEYKVAIQKKKNEEKEEKNSGSIAWT